MATSLTKPIIYEKGLQDHFRSIFQYRTIIRGYSGACSMGKAQNGDVTQNNFKMTWPLSSQFHGNHVDI